MSLPPLQIEPWIVADLDNEVGELRQEVTRLTEENEQLRRQLESAENWIKRHEIGISH